MNELEVANIPEKDGLARICHGIAYAQRLLVVSFV